MPFVVFLMTFDVCKSVSFGFGALFQQGCFESAKQLASAYKLGKGESTAAYNLMVNIESEVVTLLTDQVKILA